MGMQEEAPVAPDTFGLPEYRVTEWEIEIDGGDIRIACGHKRFGHIEWLYTVVMTPKKLTSCLEDCARMAGTGYNPMQLMDRRKSN